MRQAPEAGKETAADSKRTAIRTGFQEEIFSVHPTMVVVTDPTMAVVTDPTMVTRTHR